MKIALFISRLVVALVFIFSGIVKCVDPTGTAIKIDDYFVAWGFDVPFAISMALSIVQSVVEFTIGILLLANSWIRVAAWGALLFMVLYTPLTLYIAIANPVSDCGCFGDALKLTNWQTFIKNIILLPMSILLLWAHRQRAEKRVMRAVLNTIVGVALALLVALSGLLDEPQIDFRPYAVGVNIPNAMTVPDDAPQPEYQTLFVLEKDGVEKIFDEVNYPYNDTTWHFVTSKTTVINEGYTAPIKDFTINDRDNNLITDELLQSAEPVVIAVSAKLQDVSDEHFEMLKAMQDSARNEGRQFYILTSSVDKMDDFENRAQMGFDFLSADEVMLKTIVRSNPGIIVLQRGTIVAKYHPDHLDEANLFGDPAGAFITQQRLSIDFALKSMSIILLFVLLLIINLLYKYKVK